MRKNRSQSLFTVSYTHLDVYKRQEMECASLAAVAQLREAIWGLLLFTADSLADLENYDQRDWGSEAFEKSLELCLEMVHHL